MSGGGGGGGGEEGGGGGGGGGGVGLDEGNALGWVWSCGGEG